MINLFKQLSAEQLPLLKFPFRSELNMEAFIVENPQIITNDDMSNPQILTYELFLKDGRRDKLTDGRIDILAEFNNDTLSVIELKNTIVSQKYLEQLESYLEKFSENKVEIMNNIDSKNDYSDYKVSGVLVGCDFDSSIAIKLQNGYNTKHGCEIIGVKLNRYKTEDSSECYIMTELLSSPKSSVNRIRYDSWEIFAEIQKKKNIPNNIINVAKQIHDYFVEDKKLIVLSNVKYANTTFTLNVPQKQRKKVFAYVILRESNIKIYMVTINEELNRGISWHENRDWYPNSCFIECTSFNDDVKNAINSSYNVVINY